MFTCYPDETCGQATFAVWALESDPDAGTAEAFHCDTHDGDLTAAICSARDEIEENPASFGAFVTIGTERDSEITYAIFRGVSFNGIPEVSGFVGHADGSPVISWRDAERILRRS